MSMRFEEPKHDLSTTHTPIVHQLGNTVYLTTNLSFSSTSFSRKSLTILFPLTLSVRSANSLLSFLFVSSAFFFSDCNRFTCSSLSWQGGEGSQISNNQKRESTIQTSSVILIVSGSLNFDISYFWYFNPYLNQKRSVKAWA